MWPKKRKSSKDASSSKASTSQNTSTSQPPPPPLPRLRFHNTTHDKYYRDLLQRKLYPSRHYDQSATQALGVDEDIWFLFNNLNLGTFVSEQFLTYVEPTLEFFASFESTEVGDSDFEVSFQLFNQRRTLKLKELNQCLGFNHEADLLFPELQQFRGYAMNAWWQAITGKYEYAYNYSTASQIMHLAIRILHRILGYSVYNKKDLGKLSGEEILVLWLATNPEFGRRLNFGHLFIKNCRQVKIGRKTGHIHCGAMVTRIAIKLGYGERLKSCTIVGSESSKMLSIEHLKYASFINYTPRDGVYALLVSKTPWCFLPNPQRTSIMREDCDNVWGVERDLSLNLEARGDIGGQERGGEQEDDDDDDDDDDDVEVQEEPLVRRNSRQQQQQQQQTHQREVDSLSRQMQGTSLGSRAQQENQDGMFLQLQALYDASVSRGIVTPPVNYPYWPPQHGPIPSWTSDNAPTYPYWQGPQGPTTHYPDDSGNYDYRAPGGSDYRGDPNYPYVDPTHPTPIYGSSEPFLEPWQEDNFAGHYGWPPGYTGGWEPHGPPPSQSGWRERSDLEHWNPPGPLDGPYDGSSGPSGS